MDKTVKKIHLKVQDLKVRDRKRVAAYARVSTEKDEQQSSLEVQKNLFYKFH